MIDYRNIPICISHQKEVGSFRKRFIYYHNYGDRIVITIVAFSLRGEPKVVAYCYPTGT